MIEVQGQSEIVKLLDQQISSAKIIAERVRINIQYRNLEMCFLSDICHTTTTSSQADTIGESASNLAHQTKDKVVEKLEAQLREWQTEIA